MSAANLMFLAVIFLLIIKLFLMDQFISALEKQVTDTAQSVAMQRRQEEIKMEGHTRQNGFVFFVSWQAHSDENRNGKDAVEKESQGEAERFPLAGFIWIKQERSWATLLAETEASGTFHPLRTVFEEKQCLHFP